MKKKINISDKALKLINQNQIKPIPKWEFVFKNWGLWLGFGLCLILLILGISVSWFGLVDNVITPYFWLFIALAFFILAYLLFEKTKKAYHFPKWQIIISIILVGLIIGGVFFKIGLAANLDKQLDKNIPYYRQMVPKKMKVWNNPDSGYLSGTIIKITNNDDFKIKDFNDKVWTIKGQDALIKSRVKMEVGEEIKIVGNKNDNSNFKAKEIRPWNGMNKNMMKEN